ncbi:hydantoinase/oxoprolinase N-terminal domain-containing protein [Pontivivens insulae]|uniref:Acetophenone carboxylase gamma subunit n=1 Tax=Pontivivens insulae TaxID=1639689 RepID=A0A2R8ACF0_9RHOB|nr:hydantoinase/oxoprolinase family protein [Pontivivens insulae]RED11075.1 N-methylhydantoinase A/oxoprolinase/acetone carboxylase beta subunit [Pontivivens insulae]SPF29750.1 Acetophenone carboxylase gamma subunit [Pontivivens insulae]
MTLLLGLDTGGTYTDAALIDDTRLGDGAAAVVATAKALTTRQDLSIGIGNAISAVLQNSGRKPEEIGLVSLSTTLATNALVEGQGAPTALAFVGFGPKDLDRAGLSAALGSDPVLLGAGGHTSGGGEAAPLDIDNIRDQLSEVAGQVSAVAVASLFAVRNPAHEIALRDMIRTEFDLPVTCSHELSARINGPKRALTALLNARLVSLIDRLVQSAETLLLARGIHAPLMVVRGDGALISAEFARTRPIETILSGPAASLVGASFLTGQPDAIVSDIGGTTTDVALLSDGRPRIDPDGAKVGGARTMVEAVAMRTHGLGGDSLVDLEPGGLIPALTLGPRRAVPISLLTQEHPVVLEHLKAQLERDRPLDTDGRFVRVISADLAPAGPIRDLLEAIGGEPAALEVFALRRGADRLIGRAVATGAAQICGFTPSDAAHVLGLHTTWNIEAARLAAQLFARRRGGNGLAVFPDASSVAQAVLDQLVRRSARAVLETAAAEDGFDAGTFATSLPVEAALDGHQGLLTPRIELGVPLIGIGASAPVYYPKVAARLSAVDATPRHADVANAVGAVVGQVRITREVTILAPASGGFSVNLPSGPEVFADEAAARRRAEDVLRARLAEEMAQAGAANAVYSVDIDRRTAMVEEAEKLIEATLRVTASGRPRRTLD